MEIFTSSMRGNVLFLAASVAVAGTAQAQNEARVEKIQRTVEKQSGQSPKWNRANAGTTLVSGERLRTGKRSKSDLRFSDKSLLRLGQLSSVELNGEREVKLLQGQLLLSALSPARILAGSATAAIKGTVPYVKVFPNGDAEFSLYSGAVEVTSPQGTRNLQPGQWVRVYADGRFSDLKKVAPIFYMQGNESFDLLVAPTSEPYVGSAEEIRTREDPSRQLFDQTLATLSPESANPSYNPFTRSRGTSPSPRPAPSPIAPPGPIVPGPTPPGGGVGGGAFHGDALSEAVPSGAIGLAAVTAASGEEHLGDVNSNIGSFTSFDSQLFGAYSSGVVDGSLFAGRLSATGAKGKVFYNIALTPLSQRQDGNDRDTAFISEANLLYRTSDYDFKLGRQRIWEGPIQAAFWGSMLRQGGRTTFDAARISTRPKNGLKFDLVYLADAYPRMLASDAAGRQRGYYGRVELRNKSLAVGLNALKFHDAPVPDTTGYTADFVLPIVRDAVEVYGEVGRDPFKRKINAFGVNFPVLYDKTGIDLFLETAETKSEDFVIAPEREYAARLYKKVGRNWNVMAAINKFKDDDTRLTLGVSLGAHSTARDDAFEDFASRP